jgi:hypothetical protein
MNLMRRLASAPVRILLLVLIGVALAPAICAQAPRQLQVDVGPNQQVSILASNVSYGEVLRALQTKLGWEIEIPPLADELKISRVRVEAKPQDVLGKLLEESKLGYAFQAGEKGSHIMKVVVIPSTAGEVTATADTASSAATPDNAEAGASLPLATQGQAVTDRPDAPSKLTLSEAIRAMGVPPGISPDDVGRVKNFSLHDAPKIMGVPPGVSPVDVGRVTTLPISDAAKIIGVPPGVSPSNVGKTITLPLPTGPGKRP